MMEASETDEDAAAVGSAVEAAAVFETGGHGGGSADQLWNTLEEEASNARHRLSVGQLNFLVDGRALRAPLSSSSSCCRSRRDGLCFRLPFG